MFLKYIPAAINNDFIAAQVLTAFVPLNFQWNKVFYYLRRTFKFALHNAVYDLWVIN